MIISNEHKVDQIGRDSPGVGKYQYDYSKLASSVLSTGKGGKSYSFGTGRKFFELSQNVKLKKEL